jgi:two-component system, chemotaxis family, chemotaxis protein CheY
MKKINSALIIDDDRTSNVICENILLNAQITDKVLSFLSVEEGLAYLQKTKNTDEFPELILLDIKFPTTDGWEFLTEYKNLGMTQQTNLYVLTSSISKKDYTKALEDENVKGFITKPLTKDRILKLFS